MEGRHLCMEMRGAESSNSPTVTSSMLGSFRRDARTRDEFLDRHVFYDGKYISTELLTARLEDYSRPRPMTPDERTEFLTTYFKDSGW